MGNNNDFVGRFYEGLNGFHRAQKLEALNNRIVDSSKSKPFVSWQVVSRMPDQGKSLLSRKYDGTYGVQKIDGVDIAEESSTSISSIQPNISAKTTSLKLIEVKSSQIGDLSSSLWNTLKDKSFLKRGDELSDFLSKKYGFLKVSGELSVTKEFIYYGLTPNYLPEDLVTTALHAGDFAALNKLFLTFLAKESANLEVLVNEGVSVFELNFFDNFHPNLKNFSEKLVSPAN